MTPVVLDTGVLVGGVYWSNEPSLCVNPWLRGMVRLIVSPDIYAEYERVLREAKAEQGFPTDLVPWLATLSRAERRKLG